MHLWEKAVILKEKTDHRKEQRFNESGDWHYKSIKRIHFSDLNNLTVITTTSERYMEFFGFIEQEVFAALATFSLE